MGKPKLLLPLGSRTVLEHVITALRTAGLDRILVIAAAHLPELMTLTESAGARPLPLPSETPDMRTTVQFGLDWIEKEWSPTAADAWLLIPADHPTLEPAVVRQLVQAREQRPDRSIFVPVCDGRRGHPVLIAWGHVQRIRELPPEQGLNTYLRGQAAQTMEVPVIAPSILLDLDTPEDYLHLLATHDLASPR